MRSSRPYDTVMTMVEGRSLRRLGVVLFGGLAVPLLAAACSSEPSGTPAPEPSSGPAPAAPRELESLQEHAVPHGIIVPIRSAEEMAAEPTAPVGANYCQSHGGPAPRLVY